MKPFSLSSWTSSAGLHGAIIGIVAWWFSSTATPPLYVPLAHVFDVGSETREVSGLTPQPTSAHVSFQLPSARPSVPRSDRPPTVTKTHPEPQPATPLTKSSERITYDQYIRQHGAPTPRTALSTIPRVEAPKFDEPGKIDSKAPDYSSEIADSSFAASLLRDLQKACADAPGGEIGKMTTVEFRISRAGSLYDIRVVGDGGKRGEFETFVVGVMNGIAVTDFGAGAVGKLYRVTFRVAAPR